MSSLLSDLSFFVEESNIGFVPWKAASDIPACSNPNAHDDLVLNCDRPFYYLKSLKGLLHMQTTLVFNGLNSMMIIGRIAISI